MSFPLIRLPLVALQEVMKSMDMREILLFPFLSEKCHQVVKASISKKSALEITFTPERHFITVEISPKFRFDVKWNDRDPGHLYKIKNKLYLRTHFSTCNRCVKFRWFRSEVSEDEDLIRIMLEYFADTYKPFVSFNFNEEIRQELAIELIRYCRQNHIRLSWIIFDYGINASPEYVREILEGSIEEDAFIYIKSSVPEGFEYTSPPGGFKLGGLTVNNAHWVNLNDFLQCESVTVRGDLFHMTPQYLNKVFKTIINTECRIRSLFLSGTSFNQNNFPEIMEELSDK
ncbi:unnamed protein product [Caenorhabditis brenneri]